MSLTQIKDWDGIRSYFSKQCNRSENRMRDALMSLDVKERTVISVATGFPYSENDWPDVIDMVLYRCKNGQGADTLDTPVEATTSGVFRLSTQTRDRMTLYWRKNTRRRSLKWMIKPAQR